MSFGSLQGKKYIHEWWLVGALLLVSCVAWHQRNRLARLVRDLDVKGAWQQACYSFIALVTACCYCVGDWSCAAGHCLKTASITSWPYVCAACRWCCEFREARFEDARLSTIGFSEWIADLRAPHQQKKAEDLAVINKLRVDLMRINQKVDAHRNGYNLEHEELVEKFQEMGFNHNSLRATVDKVQKENEVVRHDAHSNATVAKQCRQDLDNIVPRYPDRDRKDYAKTVKIVAEKYFTEQLNELDDKFTRQMANFEEQPKQATPVQPSEQDIQKLIQPEVTRQVQQQVQRIRQEAQQEAQQGVQQEVQRQIAIVEKGVRVDMQKQMEQQLEQAQLRLPQQVQDDHRRIDSLEADILNMREQVNAPTVSDANMVGRLKLAESRLVDAADKLDLADLKKDIEKEIADVQYWFNSFYNQQYMWLFAVVSSITKQFPFDWDQFQAHQNAAPAQGAGLEAATDPEGPSQEISTQNNELPVSGLNVDNAQAITGDVESGTAQQPNSQAPPTTGNESVQTVGPTTPLQASNPQPATTRGVHVNDVWAWELFNKSFPGGIAEIMETNGEDKKCGFYAFIESMNEQWDVGVTFDEMEKAFMCPEVHGIMCEEWGLENMNDFTADQIAATARNWALQNTPDADAGVPAADVYIGFVADQMPGAVAVFSRDDVSGPVPEGRRRLIVWLHNDNMTDILQRQGAFAEQIGQTYNHWSGLAPPRQFAGATRRRQIKISPPGPAPVTPKRSVRFADPPAQDQPATNTANPTAPVTPPSNGATVDQNQQPLPSADLDLMSATQGVCPPDSELNTDAMDIEVDPPAQEEAKAEQWQTLAPQVLPTAISPIHEEIQNHIEDLQQRHGEAHRIAEVSAERARAEQRRARKAERDAETTQRLAQQEAERRADEESARLRQQQVFAEAAAKIRREQEESRQAAEAQRNAQEQEQEQEQERQREAQEQEQQRIAHEQEQQQRQAQEQEQQRLAHEQEQQREAQMQERQRQAAEQERQRQLQEQQPERKVEKQPVAKQTVAAKPRTKQGEVATPQTVQQKTAGQPQGQKNDSKQPRRSSRVAEADFEERFPEGATKLRTEGAEASSVRAANAVISSMAHQFPNMRRPTADELFCSLGEDKASLLPSLSKFLVDTLAQMLTEWGKKTKLSLRLGVQDSKGACAILPNGSLAGRIIWVHTLSLEKMGMCCALRHPYPVTPIVQEQNGEPFFQQTFPNGTLSISDKSRGRFQAFAALVDSVKAQHEVEISVEELEAIYKGLGIDAPKVVYEDHLAEILMTWARVYHTDGIMYLGILQDDPDANMIYLPDDVTKPKKFVFVRLGAPGYQGLKGRVKAVGRSRLGKAQQKVSTPATQDSSDTKNHGTGTNDTRPSSHESAAPQPETKEQNGRTSARQISLRTREKEGKPPAAEKLPHTEIRTQGSKPQAQMSVLPTFHPSKFTSFNFEPPSVQSDSESEASENESRGFRTANNSLFLSQSAATSWAKPSSTTQSARVTPAAQSTLSSGQQQPPPPATSIKPFQAQSGGVFDFAAASGPLITATPSDSTSLSSSFQASVPTEANMSSSFNTGQTMPFGDITSTQAIPGLGTPYSSPPPPPTPRTPPRNQGLDPAMQAEVTAALTNLKELDRKWKAENGVATTDASVPMQPVPTQYRQPTSTDVDENDMELDALEREVERDQSQL